jgi:alkylhydroperoxidase family enzyme
MCVGEELIQKILQDYETAPIDEKLRAMLTVLKKLTLEPEQVGPADIKPLRALGLSKQKIADAMYVMFLFNIYDRLADTFGWEVPGRAAFDVGAKRLLKHGYR